MPGYLSQSVSRCACALAAAAAILLSSGSGHARDTREQAAEPQVFSSFSLLGSYLAGRVAGDDKNLEAAAEYYRRALRRDPDNQEMLSEAFKVEFGAGNMVEAVSLARRLSAAGDNASGFADLLLGAQAFRQGDYARAEEIFSGLGDNPIIKLSGQLALAWTQIARGQEAQALETLSRAGAGDRLAYYQRFHTALVADLAGRTELARDNYAAAFQRRAADRRLIEAYARHAAVHGDEVLVSDILKQFSEGENADRGLSALYVRLSSEESPSLLVTSAQEGLAEAYFGIGSFLANERAASYSRIYLRLALFLRQDFDRAHYLLGEIETNDQRLEAALEAYRGVSKAAPLYLDSRIRAGFILSALERSDEGVGLLTALVDEYPEDPRLNQAIANILRDQKNFADAARYYSKAIEMIGEPEQEHWVYYYGRGISYERMKQWSKAEVDLQKALELNADQASVMNYLGYSWVDQNMHLEKAMGLIREAVRREPNNGYYVDSLGWAHYKLGQYDLAVEHLEKAVELRPEDPVLNDHLGDAYWRVGRKREARFQWSHTLSLDPEPEDRQEIEEKLADGLQDGNKKAELNDAGAANAR